MKIIADTHTHTIASTHAFSTVLENVAYAKKNGLKCIAVTDHGPVMPDAPHIWHFMNQRIIPRVLDDILVLRGAEVNILDDKGNIDLEEAVLKELDWVVASFHIQACRPKDIQYHTDAYLNLAKNPYIDVIGHSGTEAYKYDYERVIPEFKRYGKLVEINSGSFSLRKGAKENCRSIALLCKKYEVPIVVNSDCHFAPNIGKVETALQMLQEIDFPEELILNLDESRFFGYIKDKKNIDYYELLK